MALLVRRFEIKCIAMQVYIYHHYQDLRILETPTQTQSICMFKSASS